MVELYRRPPFHFKTNTIWSVKSKPHKKQDVFVKYECPATAVLFF